MIQPLVGRGEVAARAPRLDAPTEDLMHSPVRIAPVLGAATTVLLVGVAALSRRPTAMTG